MTSLTATITGRVVGPDGLGRMGRLTFSPASSTAREPVGTVLTGQASFRIDPDGYLVGQAGRSAIVFPGDYEIDLNIPGDCGVHLRRRVLLSPGQTLTLADLLTPVPAPPNLPGPVPPQPQPQPHPQPGEGGLLTPGSRGVRNAAGPGVLEASNPDEIIDLEGGALAWRTGEAGIVIPGGRDVRASGTPGILEAISGAEVIDLGDGSITWR